MSGFQTTLQRAQAKRLRRNMTVAERVLWHHLRAHRFMGLSVRRQAPVGPFIVDFLIPDHRLIIETDGGGHGNLRDTARDSWLVAQGFGVLRLWNREVMTDLPACLERIASDLASRPPD
ncbi:endonuclease domain-containing protein [Tabrizicola sp.]|uniref:endonuclease domain-containing protein n=1 Tax=Tabrizicola sp. TaxID=2005166 RepID=UPI003F36A760